jgi:hypothetical protein
MHPRFLYHGKRTSKVVQKTCVAGIAHPSLGTLALRVIEGKPGVPIKSFIREKVPRSVKVYSDGSYIYTGLRDTHRHRSQTHDLGFHNAAYIEDCWSWPKRKLFKQYYHFSKKYAHEYVQELEWRFNTRKSPKNPRIRFETRFECSNSFTLTKFLTKFSFPFLHFFFFRDF